ncbi:MAG: 2-oxoacid:ferredoxin oxidoreductase subunit beta [SAR324 cluster bacterium]|nr:2-oxoacid:ferredoxin oxidoreductase subunit beta [SAR324 cluster bacterium]
MTTIHDFDNEFENKWCPGCGNFGILDAMKQSFSNLGLAPKDVLLISGIGQAAKTPHFLNCNMFHTLHGRALAVATGAKIANHDLTIVVNSGDGDCYGEGGNHFMNAIRRNIDLTVLVHNNQVYGLTQGQASPTSKMGFVTKVQKHGVIAEPFNPLTIALTLGAGFVARGFSNNREHTRQLIEDGIKHKGFSLIDIVQPCVTYNKINTHGWYKQRVQDLYESKYVPNDLEKAFAMAQEWDEKIPIGVYYRKEGPSFTDRIKKLAAGTLISKKYDATKLDRYLSVS